MRDWLLKDLRLKLFCLALAFLIWEAVHLEIQHAHSERGYTPVPGLVPGATNRPPPPPAGPARAEKW